MITRARIIFLNESKPRIKTREKTQQRKRKKKELRKSGHDFRQNSKIEFCSRMD